MRCLGFISWPEEASSLAPEVDWIFYTLIVLCAAVTLLVLILILLFCIRYRRGSKALRTGDPSSLPFEIGWTLPTLLIFLVVFFWAAKVYFRMMRSPASATEIHVVAKQWMWKIQHADGRREINELHLPVGRPVKLLMTSQDVIHDFFVPAFRTKQDVLPGCYTSLWFVPTKPGKFHLFCAQYCGLDHSRMGGWIYVMEPDDYARWLARESAPDSLAAQGERAFRSLGCSGCHAVDSKIHAPLLDGIYGKPVPLTNGVMVIADDQYLRDSILLPNKQIAAGYEALMPTFQNRISEEDLTAIIEYLKSLGDAERKIR